MLSARRGVVRTPNVLLFVLLWGAVIVFTTIALYKLTNFNKTIMAASLGEAAVALFFGWAIFYYFTEAVKKLNRLQYSFKNI